MTQYINKSALVAEMERRILEDYNTGDNEKDAVAQGAIASLKYYIEDTLEVKEVQEEPVSDTQSPVIFYGLTGSVGSPKEEPVSEQNLSNVQRTVKNWKEPVNEELGDYINKLSKQFPEVSFAKLSRIAVRVAKWQKQQDKETIEVAEDHAMLAGMEKMKEQMMAKENGSEFRQEISVTGRNIDDIFRLECVRSVVKGLDGQPLFILKDGQSAHIGDTLRENQAGRWIVKRGGAG